MRCRFVVDPGESSAEEAEGSNSIRTVTTPTSPRCRSGERSAAELSERNWPIAHEWAVWRRHVAWVSVALPPPRMSVQGRLRAYARRMATPLAPGWEIKFRLACAERRGDAYQEFFAQIMERRDPGFQRVRPWGTAGDRKNDGWSPGRRMLFQCYAPSTLSASELVSKLVDDYAGAIEYWKDYFDTWVFVHDDLQGMAPMVARKVAELNKKSSDVSCTAWGQPELREEFAALHDADRAAILGPALTTHDFLSVAAQTLKPLLDALGLMAPDPATPIAAVPPDKIEANDLNPYQVDFLKLGASRAPLVEQYLTQAYLLPSHADEIAQAVSERYNQLRWQGLSPAVTFDLLLAWVSGGAGDSATLANALAIVAYFFERCHIFEVPSAVAP